MEAMGKKKEIGETGKQNRMYRRGKRRNRETDENTRGCIIKIKNEEDLNEGINLTMKEEGRKR